MSSRVLRASLEDGLRRERKLAEQCRRRLTLLPDHSTTYAVGIATLERVHVAAAEVYRKALAEADMDEGIVPDRIPENIASPPFGSLPCDQMMVDALRKPCP